MKKTAILILAVSAMSVMSCKKMYTCECTTTVNDAGDISTDTETKSSEIKMSKKNAKNWCSNMAPASESGPDYQESTECKLK